MLIWAHMRPFNSAWNSPHGAPELEKQETPEGRNNDAEWLIAPFVPAKENPRQPGVSETPWVPPPESAEVHPIVSKDIHFFLTGGGLLLIQQMKQVLYVPFI